MRPITRLAGMGAWIVSAAIWIALLGILSSCSFFESDVRVSTPKYCPPPKEPEATNLPYCRVDLELPLTAVQRPALYVYKSERRLLLVNEGTLVRDYTIGLGPHPNGDKSIRGDGRTPEGEFFICAKNPDSKYYKSLGLSYPAPKHAEEALVSGRISFDEYRNIVQSNNEMKLPPANTALGGAIFIHGGGADRDWTLGCIAVYNKVIDDLFEIIPVGTPVYVLP